jgi:transcriptional regulator with XRE-family HTH domain
MSNKTIGSIMIREIIRMKEMGFSMRKIARSLGKSRTTISKYVTNIEASDLSFKELLELTSEDIYELFGIPQNIASSNTDVIQKELLAFYPYVEKELKRVGVTRHILWDEYKEKHPQGVMYSRFCESYRQWSKKSDGYMPVGHKYGEKLFIDYAGKKLHIIDRQTGEIKPVEVFVATLGASQYTYIEASFSQQIPDFISIITQLNGFLFKSSVINFTHLFHKLKLRLYS